MFELPKLLHSPLGLVTLVPPFNYDTGTEVISGSTLVHTENAVFTHEGRYFVAGEHSDPKLGSGIYEVVRTSSGHGVEQVVPGLLAVGAVQHKCWFHGLTTDGTYLYTLAAVHPDNHPLKMSHEALFRILPKKHAPEVSVAPCGAGEIHFYNGMAVGPDGAVYMSNSLALSDGSKVAIYKVTIQALEPFQIRIEPWLPACPLRDISPNGIQIKDDTMYYASGKWLHEITITPSGPGALVHVYLSIIPNNRLDDLAILPDGRIAVGEFDFLMNNANGFEGWGVNQIVTVDPNGMMPLNQKVTLTSPYTVSSLVYSEGDLFARDKLITTSWFHGGIREIGAL